MGNASMQELLDTLRFLPGWAAQMAFSWVCEYGIALHGVARMSFSVFLDRMDIIYEIAWIVALMIIVYC